MSLLFAAHEWIECAWREMGKNFGADDVQVGQFERFNTDDLSFPFKNSAIDSWRLLSGQLQASSAANITRVPYIAFCLDEPNSVVRIQVQWASRCGYGWDLSFGPSGEVVEQKMRWVS